MESLRTFTIPYLAFLLYLLPSHAISADKFNARDMDHAKSHLQGTVNFSNLTQRELLFHYFQVHDIEGNNKLDGCEILQSVLHIYSEAAGKNGATVRIFTDLEFADIVDPVLKRNDKNHDGFIDYGEFLNGEMARAY